MTVTWARALPALFVAALLSLGTVGCSRGLQPVRGQVTLEDGKPLTSGLVVFEGKEKGVTARGEIQSDGSYRLGTYKPGDGAPAGKYRVLVTPPPPENPDVPLPKPTFDPRFTDLATSGLEFEVKSGANEFPIRLPRPGKR